MMLDLAVALILFGRLRTVDETRDLHSTYAQQVLLSRAFEFLLDGLQVSLSCALVAARRVLSLPPVRSE